MIHLPPLLQGYLAEMAALITENREQHERLAEVIHELGAREAEYDALFHEMIDGIAVHDIILDAAGEPTDYRFLEVNQAFEQLTGLRREDIVGRTALEALPGLERHWIETYGRVALTGEEARFESYSEVLDRWYQVVAYQPSGRQHRGRFVVVFSDISERKATEEELRRTADARQAAYTREREVALYLQRALLPDVAIPEGYEIDAAYASAAGEAIIGGDFYDLIALPRGGLAAVVGDVCGKGLSAAVQMAVVRHTLWAYGNLGLEPGDWLTLTNQTIMRAPEEASFATVGLVVFDSVGHTLTVASAGHPPPLIVREGEVRELRAPAGLPLAAEDGQRYDSAAVHVDGPFLVVLYTDGLSEARTGPVLFGTERLPQLALELADRPLQGQADQLIREARSYAGGELKDDVVVVLIRPTTSIH